MIKDPIDAGRLWQVRGEESAVLGSADDSEGALGNELCREVVREQAPVILEMACVARLLT